MLLKFDLLYACFVLHNNSALNPAVVFNSYTQLTFC